MNLEGHSTTVYGELLHPLLFYSHLGNPCECAIISGTEGHLGSFQSFLLTSSDRMNHLCLGHFVFLSFFPSEKFLEVGLPTEGTCTFAGCRQISFGRGCTTCFPECRRGFVREAEWAFEILQAWCFFILWK